MAGGNDECQRESDHDEVNDEEGREFVRCRLVARTFKPRQEGPRDDLMGSGASARGEGGEPKVNLTFVDLKKAHLASSPQKQPTIVSFPTTPGRLWHTR